MVESALDLGHYERGLRAQGFRLIAGVDEAGRGALAGPLVAAAVILPDGFDLEGINDSKVLTANQREVAFDRIVADAVAWSVHRLTRHPSGMSGSSAQFPLRRQGFSATPLSTRDRASPHWRAPSEPDLWR